MSFASSRRFLCGSIALLGALTMRLQAEDPVSYSGIYPHLTMYNREGECGTGAVVPWANRLWVITYAPHMPRGSSDKFYEITPQLEQIIRPESVGGTPANRLIHDESKQLFIGPYVVDEKGGVRVIPPAQMFGRLTGMARHLTDPANKVYYATMEEGIYEADVHSLAVTKLWSDEADKQGRHSDLPGYHGKGFYSGQGVVVYANNGDHSQEAVRNPNAPSGALAEWDGKADAWNLIRRNQFTEVSGPGGIHGNPHPETDPLWSIGWDYRSLILMLREGGQWQSFRLPKASHSYDGGHGWHTEWPRIREIGEKDFLMSMHGTFWRFPATFSLANTAGIAPRSTFLKVTGDFCRWGDRIVVGCDDSAKNEFTNKRKAKGALAGPGQSQSNLWFLEPGQLDHLGPVAGAGAVWMNEAVKAGAPSDPFLFSGYERRGVHLSSTTAGPVTVRLETNDGKGAWRKLRDVTFEKYQWLEFAPGETGAWIRLTAAKDLAGASAVFQYSNAESRASEPTAMFSDLAPASAKDFTGGTMLQRGEDLHTLGFASATVEGGKITGEGLYELSFDTAFHLRRQEDPAALEKLKKDTAVPAGIISCDAASVLFIDDKGLRWRVPKTDQSYEAAQPVALRVCREIATERDLFQAHGTFFELPAVTSGGFAKVRAVSTHRRMITDYIGFRGLLILSGCGLGAKEGSHVIKSEDGKVALWVGGIDDLWSLGKPTGHGGPWADTAVTAGTVSDPYLMRGYDKKRLVVSQQSNQAASFVVEIDPYGEGQWQPYRAITCMPREQTTIDFPAAFSAYWVRMKSNSDCTATAQLTYE